MLAPLMRNSKTSWDDLSFFADPKSTASLELWLDEPESQQFLGMKPAPTAFTSCTAPVMKPTGPKDWAAPGKMPAAQCSCASNTPALMQQHLCPPAASPMQSVGSLCPMAFWSIETRKLLAFNDGFIRLMQLPAEYLQRGGVQWDNFADAWRCDPNQRSDAEESYARLKVLL
jgi:hypothetical protein